MNNGLNPALFARVLKLDTGIRTDILELLGTASLLDADIEYILDQVEHPTRSSLATPPTGRRPS